MYLDILTVVDVGVHEEGYSQLDEVVAHVLDVDLLVAIPLAHRSGVTIQLLHPPQLGEKNKSPEKKSVHAQQ